MYKLYRQPNGQVKQVPVNEPQEDQFPNPLEAKGQEQTVAPFILQEERQFDLIKENTSQQARFQTKKLQNSNYQIINFRIAPTDSTSTQAYYYNEYNIATAVGSPLDSGVMFGTNTADVTKAKYYNIVYINARFVNDGNATTDFIVNPSFIEFFPIQKLPTGDFGGKIPRQIEAVKNATGTFDIGVDGSNYGVQSFGVDVYGENAYYTQSPDLKGIRACGVALRNIRLNFQNAIDISTIRLDIEIGYDLNTEGNNY